MKFSLDWLRSYVDLEEAPRRIGELLAEAGLPVDSIEPWGADHQLDVDVMANRPDCMGHIGLARELAARLGRPLRRPPAEPRPSGKPAAELATVEVEDPDLCPRYTALVITGISVGPSPDWLSDRLASIGLRSVNNVVDVTNFILHEYGQPLHAFDLDRLAGQRIIVRRARPRETLRSLDGSLLSLAPEHLVIADAERPVALAGIMGGIESEISPQTTRVLLESAHFDPVVTRRSARQFQLHTDASHRFERGTDPGVTKEAALRAATMIEEVAGGTLAPGELDLGAETAKRQGLSLSLTHLSRLLGLDVEPEKAASCLASLGFDVNPPEWNDGEALIQVSVPTWRSDVRQEVDLIEEVARMIGYDAIPLTVPAFTSERAGRPAPSAGFDRVRRYLVAAGYHEGLSFPMSDREIQSPFVANLTAGRSFVEIDNPLNLRMATLRISLIPGLLAGVAHNLNRGMENIKLFEIGRVFCEAADDETPPLPEGTGPAGVRLPIEQTHLAVVARGAISPPHWNRSPQNVDYFDLKGVLEGIAGTVLGRPCDVVPPDSALPFLAEGVGGLVQIDGTAAGFIGRFAPDLASARDLPDDLYLLEVDITGISTTSPHLAFHSPSRHPAVDRDLALILDRQVRYREVAALIREEGGELLESLRAFDHYAGGSIPAGKYSLGIRLSFRHAERTLTADEVQSIQQRIVGRLASQLRARLRDAPGSGQ